MTQTPSERGPRRDSRVTTRLEGAGYRLLAAPDPVGNYIAARRDGDVIRLSGLTDRGRAGANGQGPLRADSDLAPARTAATFAAMNLIAAAATVVDDLDTIVDVVHLRGYVWSAADFTRHPQVIDAASELLHRALEPSQPHTRAAIGVASLPGGALVELEASLRVGASG